MKKLVLLSVAAVSGMFAMNASALTNGWESVNIHATMSYQGEGKILKVSFGNKDALALIGENLGYTIPNGAKLVSYGNGTEEYEEAEFAVLNANNSVFIENASFDGNYEFYYYPGPTSSTLYNEVGNEAYNFTCASADLYYSDVTDTYSFNITGPATDNVNYNSGKESYNLPKASGFFHMPLPNTSTEDGQMTGSVSGSGTVNYPYWYE